MRYKIGPLEEWLSLRPCAQYARELSAALFLRLGVPSTLIRLENAAFENAFQIGKEERFLHLTFELSVIWKERGKYRNYTK